MPEAALHVIAEDLAQPNQVLAAAVPFTDFDQGMGWVVVHDIATGWSGPPVPFQAILKGGDWGASEQNEVSVEIDTAALETLREHSRPV